MSEETKNIPPVPPIPLTPVGENVTPVPIIIPATTPDEKLKESVMAKVETPTAVVSEPVAEEKSELREWDTDNLPKVRKVMKLVPPEFLKGNNDVNAILKEFSDYLNKSKRVGSGETKRKYLHFVRQFLIWCNEAKYGIINVTSAGILKDLVIVYNQVLCNDKKLSQNTIAFAMASVHKFWEFFDFKDAKLNLRHAFSAEWVTTQDTNAFKKQIRISEDVYEAMKNVVKRNGTMQEKWIFFLLAYGCRRSEICGAKVSDIDMINKCIQVYQFKVRDIKKLPLPDWYTGLKMFFDGQVFLVYNNSKRCAKVKGKVPVTGHYIYRVIQHWLSQTSFAGDIRVTPHSFRRYFVNQLQKKNYSDSNIAKLGGWKHLATLQKYGWDLEVSANPIIENKDVSY